MKITLRARTGVVAFAVLAACITPRAAATERTNERDRKIPIIRVIVDNEAQLALIPQGTVLPAGFQIISSRDETADSQSVTSRFERVSRPLVFAYAPAKRFEKLAVKETPRGADVEVVEFTERGATATAAAIIENPCPAVFVVEVGPEIVHQVTCDYETTQSGRTEVFWSFTSYPTTARSSSIIRGLLDPAGNLNLRTVTTCSVSAGQCSTPGMGMVGWPETWSYQSTAAVRLYGACTQDPPFCPDYTNSIVIPIFSR